MDKAKTMKQLLVQYDIENLTDVARIAGTYRQNLYNWSHAKPELFKVILTGASILLRREKIERLKSSEH